MPYYHARWYVDGSIFKEITSNAGLDLEKVDDPVKEGYTFLRWDADPRISSNYLLADTIYTAVFEKNPTETFTLKFYRMTGGPDDYDTVELLGTEEVEKGTNASTLVSQYEQKAKELKGGGMIVTKINKGSYTDVTMDMDIYYY